MRIEALECFHEIMKSGSIRQAASSRYITQQGLSKVVQSLETELGVRLFQKRGRNIVPTAEGLTLDEFAQEVIAAHAELHRRLKMIAVEEDTSAVSNMPLYITPFVGNGLFGKLRSEMDEAQIGTDQLIIREANVKDIIASFKAGEIDLALLNMLEEDYVRLQALAKPVTLLTSEIVLVVPRVLYNALPKKAVTPEIFSRLPIAYYNDDVLNGFVNEFCRSAGYSELRLFNHSTNISSIHSMVENGQCATFGDTFSLTLKEAMEGIVLMPFDPPQRFVVFFLINPELNESSPQRRYISRFKEMLYDNHGAFLRDSFMNV